MHIDDLELLEYLLEDEGVNLGQPQGISPRDNPDDIPLSSAQTRLWFLTQLDPQSYAYNLPGALRLQGKLNIKAFEASINEIIKRHEVLRTTFTEIEGQPQGTVTPHLTLTLPIIDLRSHSEAEKIAKVQQLTQEDQQTPFNLVEGPLWRFKLLRLTDTEQILLLNFHHIVADAWSKGVFIEELRQLYQAFSQGKSSPLPVLPLQYADFAHWQQTRLQGAVFQEQRDYWMAQLANITPLSLPTDKPYPLTQTFSGTDESFSLSPRLTQQLKALAKQQDSTLFMALLSAFVILLYRYSQQEDICVGSPIANRSHSEIEPLIGFFLNTLVLRVDLSENPSFFDLLKQVRRVCLEAYAHQDFPFEKLVEQLQPERHLNQSPLFQVMFTLQTNIAKENLSFSGLSVEAIENNWETAKFDLSLLIEEDEESLQGIFEYKTDLFEPETIKRMVGHFLTLLESIILNPNQRIQTLHLLTKPEQEFLLTHWNQTQVNYPKEESLHQLFEKQVKKNPDKIAIEFEGQSLTYQQLNYQSNNLAYFLQELDIKANDLVGISIERSLEMVMGLLGILKAGGAYIPIDPAYPSDRINYMLEDSQAKVLLTQQSLLSQFSNYNGKIVCIEEINPHLSTPNPQSLNPETAYIIYTSGSTGKPKGVQISHQAIVNFLYSMAQQPGINSEDVLLSVTTLSFDIAGLEIFLPLITGAKVILLSQETVIDGVALRQKLDESKATIMQATPATWQMLIDADWRGNKQLKVLCGGEALSKTLAQQLLAKSAELWNMYGPTETTVWSMIQKIESEELISIGHPINNTQIYILDPNLQPVPIGVPGELYIGGDGLAIGYLNRPELTEQKFIQSPFEPKGKIYKTGDLARYLPNGTVDCLGRIDHQVKIRGFRVELGEIENLINQYSEIKNAVVIAKKEASEMNRLVAYYIPNQDSSIDLENLRNFLRQQLPDYMIPSIFVSLKEFPLTPNGKINRRALPKPNQTASDNSYIAPRTPIEKALVTIWTDILKVTVGIHDDFFTLGGHSLLATQVISRIRQELVVEIPLKSLFEFPTIAQLSAVIDEFSHPYSAVRRRSLRVTVGQQTALTAKPVIQKVSREQPLPLSFAQQRLWFLDQLESGNSSYNISVAVQLEGNLNEKALEDSLNEIVRRHEVLRTTFKLDNGQPVQVISPQLYIPLVKNDLRFLSGIDQEKEIKLIATKESKTHFDLQKSPLLKTRLLQLQDSNYILVFTVHHIIFDVWSSGVIITELSKLYDAFCQNKPSPLSDLSIQYADFSCWQHQYLQKEILEQELNYWRQKLANLPVLNLHKIEKKNSFTLSRNSLNSSHSFTLSQSLSKQLNLLSQQAGVTLFMTILATLNTLLYRYTEQDDIIIGTDIANRNQGETEQLIGFFINILLLRTDLSGNPSFRELLSRTRETTLEAYAHQDLPFAKLVETLQPERSLEQTPLFQVLLVFQNAPVPPLELTGLTLKPLELKEGEAKFDLVLFIEETPQGITGTWKHKPNQLTPTTLHQLSNHFQTLLQSIVNHPDLPIDSLEIQTEAEKQQQIMQQFKREKSKFSKFKKLKGINPKAVALSQQQLIKTQQFNPNQTLPLIIQPNIQDIDVREWAENNREFIDKKLQQHGAILFRGFNLNKVSEFETLAQAICPNLFGNYGDLPREGISNKVYGATPYPADKAILFHNESSHLNSWPQKIWFFCVQPAEKGGETPIIDCRKIYQKLNADIKEILEKKKLMYVRNYIKDFDVSWQDFFKTDNKKEVENYCQKNKIQWEWLPNDGLKTKKICPAIIQHPVTQETVFFNQVQLHHISFLDADVRHSLLSNFGYEGLPRNVYYGDGSPIKEEVMQHIKSIYQELSISFPWEKGDVLMLDNMLTAHSRNPYQGKRKIVVAMGKLISLRGDIL